MNDSTPPKRSRRTISRMPAEKRIADIMRAAREVFSEYGYSEALISDIAERAGVVEGSIYRFFKNKRDLLVQMVEDWYDELLTDDSHQFEASEGTRNRLRYIIYHHLLSIRAEPALSRLALQELRSGPDYRDSAMFRRNQIYTNRIMVLVREAVARGEFRPEVSPALVRDMVYGSIEHHTWGFLRNEGDFDVIATSDGLADMIYRGLLADRPEAGTATVLDRLERIAERMETAAQPSK